MTLGIRLNIREEMPERLRRRRRHRAGAVLRVHRPDRLRARRRRQPVGQPQLHPADVLRARRVRPAGRRAEAGDQPAGGPHRPDHRPRRRRARPRRRRRRHRRHGPGPHRRRRPAGQGPRRADGGDPPLRRRQRVHQPPLRRGPAVRLRGQPDDQPRGRRPVADRLERAAGCSSSAAVPPAWSSPRSPARAAWTVDLWEADDELGGQLRYAVRAPRHEGYAAYLRWQEQRLADLGVQRPPAAGAPPRTTSSPTARTPSRSRPAPARGDPTSPAPTPRTCSTSATSSPAGPPPATGCW